MRLEWEKEEKGSRKAFEENKEERHKESLDDVPVTAPTKNG